MSLYANDEIVVPDCHQPTVNWPVLPSRNWVRMTLSAFCAMLFSASYCRVTVVACPRCR